MGDVVSDAAWAAYREVEAEKTRARDALARREAQKRQTAAAKLIKKHAHLLEESGLAEWFPTADLTIIAASDQGRHGGPTILVKERESGVYSPEFSIDETGVYIPDENELVQVTSAYDVGRCLKRKADALDEAYRRNPD